MITIYIIMLCIWAVDVLLMIRHCKTGTGGYPDAWDDPIQELIHGLLVLLFVFCLLIFVAIVALGKR